MTTRNLPRLLEEGRVEVRLSSIGGTHVLEESGIDRLLSHLTEAKSLLSPNRNAKVTVNACSKCNGWQFYTVSEIDGREGVVLQCSKCKTIERIRRDAE